MSVACTIPQPLIPGVYIGPSFLVPHGTRGEYQARQFIGEEEEVGIFRVPWGDAYPVSRSYLFQPDNIPIEL